VVKLGAQGCLAVGPDEAELTAPAPSVSVADTTGAGDAFNAGLVSALDGGAGWPDALVAATQFASMIVARPSDDRYRPELVDGARQE
jgi:sugar/nucleoside kinase (ribokinase family)